MKQIYILKIIFFQAIKEPRKLWKFLIHIPKKRYRAIKNKTLSALFNISFFYNLKIYVIKSKQALYKHSIITVRSTQNNYDQKLINYSINFSKKSFDTLRLSSDQPLTPSEFIILTSLIQNIKYSWLYLYDSNQKSVSNKTFIHPKAVKSLVKSLSPEINLDDNQKIRLNNKTVQYQFSEHTRAPLVTVILSVFNDEDYIANAIHSILKQSHKNIELIIVNDCSTDNTKNIIDQIATKHRNIKTFHLDKNRGTYYCRNTGLNHAKGDYITFHDSDDISKFDRIELSLKKIGNASALVGHHIRVNLEGSPVFLPASPLALQRFSLITLFIKHDIIDKVGFFDTVKVGGDSEYLSRIKESKTDVKVINDVFYYARLHNKSLTKSKTLGVNAPNSKKKNILRTRYINNYKRFHGKHTQLKMAFNPILRSFPAPYLNISSLQSDYLKQVYKPLKEKNLNSIIQNCTVNLISDSILNSKVLLPPPVELLQHNDEKKRAHIVTSVYRKEFFQNCLNNFNRQKYKNKHLSIVDNCKEDTQDYFNSELKKAKIDNYSIIRVDTKNNLGLCLNQAIKKFSQSDDIIFKFDDDDYYSPLYVHEQIPYINQLDTLVGKACIFYYSHNSNTLFLRSIKKKPYNFTFHVSGCTLAFSYKKWLEVGQFSEGLTKGTDSDFIKKFLKLGIQPFSTSIFNCCAVRHKKSIHTWNVSEKQLFHSNQTALVSKNLAFNKLSYYTDIKNVYVKN